MSASRKILKLIQIENPINYNELILVLMKSAANIGWRNVDVTQIF